MRWLQFFVIATFEKSAIFKFEMISSSLNKFWKKTFYKLRKIYVFPFKKLQAQSLLSSHTNK